MKRSAIVSLSWRPPTTRTACTSAGSPTCSATPRGAASTVTCAPATTPQSASEVADVFGLHRTVARAHLEKLTRDRTSSPPSTRRRPGGGRPAKIYAVTDARLEIMLPPRRYERLARLLLRSIDETLEPEVAVATATTLGRAYGEQTAEDFAGDGHERPGQALAARRHGLDGPVGLRRDPRVQRQRRDRHRGPQLRLPGALRRSSPRWCAPSTAACSAACSASTRRSHTQTHALSAGDSYCRHEFTTLARDPASGVVRRRPPRERVHRVVQPEEVRELVERPHRQQPHRRQRARP